MIVNAVFPIVEFFGFWFMRFGFRLMDRGFTSCNSYDTKKTSIQQYVELYSGPVYLMHFKYSVILNVSFITFMYGLALPILFPIAAFSFLVLFLAEKIQFYYSYRMPPMYDERLNRSVLTTLTYTPLFMFAFGFWMLSNRMLFGNDVVWRTRTTDSVTNHYWTDAFDSEKLGVSKQALPLYIGFWFFLLTIFFRNSIYSVFIKLFPGMKVGHIHIEENLPNYFATLDKQDREWSKAEEKNAREKLGFSILNDEAYENLDKIPPGKRQMQGVHCYDILANPLYTDDFQYFSAAIPEREKYIIDDDDDEENDCAQSDLVRLVLNLAFLTEDKAVNFTFSKETYKAHLKGELGHLFKKGLGIQNE